MKFAWNWFGISVFLAAEGSLELFIDEDDTSARSDDSLAILPDLSSYTRDVNELDLRVGRPHSALRRNRPAGSGGTADKIPFGISHVDISFPCSTKASSYKNSGKTLVVDCIYLVLATVLLLLDMVYKCY